MGFFRARFHLPLSPLFFPPSPSFRRGQPQDWVSGWQAGSGVSPGSTMLGSVPVYDVGFRPGYALSGSVSIRAMRVEHGVAFCRNAMFHSVLLPEFPFRIRWRRVVLAEIKSSCLLSSCLAECWSTCLVERTRTSDEATQVRSCA